MNDLAFVRDERVDIVAPKERAKTSLPVTIRWTAKRLPAGSFGVIVDQAPPRPGKTLAQLFSGSDFCKGPGGKELCASDAFLNERGAYVTKKTSLRLARLPEKSDDGRREFHEVTIILLDVQGRRVGESGWTVQFELKK